MFLVKVEKKFEPTTLEPGDILVVDVRSKSCWMKRASSRPMKFVKSDGNSYRVLDLDLVYGDGQDRLAERFREKHDFDITRGGVLEWKEKPDKVGFRLHIQGRRKFVAHAVTPQGS